jgi:hypothetical protein
MDDHEPDNELMDDVLDAINRLLTDITTRHATEETHLAVIEICLAQTMECIEKLATSRAHGRALVEQQATKMMNDWDEICEHSDRLALK